MANLKFGSAGKDVEKLQQALGFTGKDVDGIFGKKTQQAVIDYQKANGLTVDGIAGAKTQGKLYAPKATGSNTGSKQPTTSGTKTTSPSSGSSSGKTSTTTTTATTTTAPTTTAPTTTAPAQAQPFTYQPFTYQPFTYQDFTYQDFAPSDVVTQADALLQQHQVNKPGDYTPVWQDEADAYLSQFLNRDKFAYDVNSDALYQQYRDQYVQQGQLATLDAMGQAATMTGGYANSYAQTAGQQAYNQYLSQLNAIVPELAQMAEDRYNREGQNMLAMYDLYMNRDAQERANHEAGVDRWYQEMARLQDSYDSLYARDWNEYLEGKDTAYDAYTTGRNEAYNTYTTGRDEAFKDYQATIDREYQKERDAVADAQWQATFDENKRQADRAYESRSTGSSNGGTTEDTPKYRTLIPGSSEYNTIQTKILRAKTPEELKSITEEFMGMYGYDNLVNMQVYKTKLAELLGQSNPNDTYVPPAGNKPTTGGGGGRRYMTTR